MAEKANSPNITSSNFNQFIENIRTNKTNNPPKSNNVKQT
jgi:hypothetical protein